MLAEGSQAAMQEDERVVESYLGRYGVGKTSLLRAVCGQHPVRAGSIVWDGADITVAPPHERAARGGDLSGGQQQLAIARACWCSTSRRKAFSRASSRTSSG